MIPPSGHPFSPFRAAALLFDVSMRVRRIALALRKHPSHYAIIYWLPHGACAGTTELTPL